MSSSITYRYDKAGRLAGYEQKDGSGKLISQADYSRDALGRISQEQLIYGDGANRITATLAQGWDADGRKTSQGYPDGSAAAFSYDKGYLKEATQPGSTDKITWADYQWMLPTKVQYPGASRSIAYDGFYRIQGIQVQGASNANLLTLGYQYDVESSITRKTLQLGADVNGTVDYAYDALDRLTQARPSTSLAGLGLPQEQYGYDAVHNRISSLHQPGEWQYASGNRLTQRGLGTDLVRYDYTATGHIQSATRNGSVTTNIYDATERRVAVEKDGQLIARYQYDPFGRRISKTLGAGQGGQTTWFVYGAQGLLAELDANGKTAKTYGWQPGTDWGTEPLWQADHASAQNSSSRTYHYLHNDHLSTPQIASDATGRSSWQALSESFGHTLERSGNRTRMNLRFAGQYFDEETGAHYNQQRDYAPGLGRYVQRDPIGLSGGINVYGYGYGNPLAYADPDGLVPLVLAPCVAPPYGPYMCAAMAGAAATAAANACSNAVDAIKDWMSSSETSNPMTGDPGCEVECKNNKGNRKQTRRYGPDGFPETDTDWDHSHDGLGKPHSHDWGRPEGGGRPGHRDRGEGRPSVPGDPGFPKQK